MTKEQTLKNLSQALRDFLDPEYLNRWISVKERSITKILLKHNVSAVFSSAVYDVLVKCGLIERTGVTANMRYKIDITVIPDFDGLAETVYNNFYEKVKERKELPGYQPSKKADLQPKQVKTNFDPVRSSDVVVQKPCQFNINDKCFILWDGKIHQGRIVSVFLVKEDNNKESIHYDVEFLVEDKLYTHYQVASSLKFCKVFKDKESLLEFLSRKTCYYKVI